MESRGRSFLQSVLFILVFVSAICGSKGSASESLAVSPPNLVAASPKTTPDVSKKNTWSIITKEMLITGLQKEKLGNNSLLQALGPVSSPQRRVLPNITGLAPLATHSTQNIIFHGLAVSPALAAPPVKHEQSYGIPVAASSKGIAGPMYPINHSYEKGFPPVMIPDQPEVNVISNITEGPLVSPSHSSGSLPMMSPVSHEEMHADSPFSSHPHSSVSAPVISPAPHEIKPPANAHAPLASHTKPSGSSSIINPMPHARNTLSNTTISPSPLPHEMKHAPLSSHPQPSGPFPLISPMPHQFKEPPNATRSPLPLFPLPLETSTSISPTPHETEEPSSNTQSPLPSYMPRLEYSPAESPAPHEVTIIAEPPLTSHPNSSGLSPTLSPTHSPPSHPILVEFSPAIIPTPHEIKDPSNITHAPLASDPKSSRISPMISPTIHEEKDPSNITHSHFHSHPPLEVSSPLPPHFSAKDPSNITHAPLPSHPEPSRISPMISSTPYEVKEPSNITLSPFPSHALPSTICPTPHEVNGPSNSTLPPLSSHPVPSLPSPMRSPAPDEVKEPSNITHSSLPSHLSPLENSPAVSPALHGVKYPLNETEAPLASHPRLMGSSPLLSPMSHEVNNVTNITHSPFSSHLLPPSERIIQTPALAPTISRPQHGAQLSLYPPSAHYSGPAISPVPSHSTEIPTNNKRRNFTPSPYIRGPSISPMQSLMHPPEVVPKHNQRNQAPSRYPVQSPFPSKSREVSHAPSPSSVMRLRHNKWPMHSPILPPGSSRKPRAPPPQIVWALPPPPPNFDCKSLSCQEPVTYPPPESICVCVLPIKVGLRLGISLYTFFPLVTELAQEMASGIFAKQSQVRIMGANAASENPEKTVVLIDLVPLGRSFDINTALLIYESFWHKQVLIKASYFGDYDVLYVDYPGLPPSPPVAPGDVTVDGGTFTNGENARMIKPLGIDVRKRKAKLSGSLIATIVLSSMTVLAISVGAVWILLVKRRNHSDQPPSTSQQPIPLVAKSSGSVPPMLGSGPSSTSASFTSSTSKTFSLAEIERATNRFHDSRLIGEGGFGRVYQGTLEDGTMVAVKVLKRADHQGGRQFLAEVEMLSRLHHRNLVKLIGICTEENVLCLVCELIPNGSVESHLHELDKETSPLDWNARMKIALGAARGLAYLHEDSSPRVIHRDFKSSNILLEHDFTPKVSDFGLAREALDEGSDRIFTRVMGTFGYVAPEYAMTGHLLVKSDVYSYGVVLLELLTGRRPVDMSQPPGQETLVNWSRPLLTSADGLETMLDPALGTSVSLDIVAKVAAIASMCVQPEFSNRPYMGEVVQALKLVCNGSDERRRSYSHDESSTRDADVRISTEERMLSESDVFCASATFDKDASGSFRRYSSSGPMRTGSGKRLWERVRGFSSGNIAENQAGQRLGSGMV